jgi:uncharacterized membrane protein (DUF4010 family)
LHMPPLGTLFARFGLALFLGFLIGLERERDKPLIFAGMRTFALISLLGAVLAFVAEQFVGPWMFVAGFVAVAAFALLSHFQGLETGHVGTTTEVAFLIAFLLGALVYWDLLILAAAVTVAVVLVLSFKPNLQSFAANIDRQDIWAGLEFAVVWVIVLPLLPNRTYGPLDVLNPHQIWLMVVLVAGLNLFGYILSQVYGRGRSIGLTGALGGLVSSTGVTFQFARRSKTEQGQHDAPLLAFAITIASIGMYLRAQALVLVINRSLGVSILPPMLTGALILALGALWLWRQVNRADTSQQEPSGKAARSPFALGPALQFGAIFAVVLLASKAAQVYLGEAGTYLSSLIGGLVGLDAVILSMAQLADSAIPPSVASHGVVLGTAANMLFKGVITLLLGSQSVRRYIMPLFAMTAIASTGVAFLLP